MYRLVWSMAEGDWRVASEIGPRRAKGTGRHRTRAARCLAVGSACLVPAMAMAGELPSGGTVVAGDAAIERQGDNLTIQQSSQRAAIEWDEYSIGEGNTVRYDQPGAEAAALNRVTGDRISEIRGALEANGRVFLVNPNGVHFSPSARVDVGSLVASTLDISTEDFMNGDYRFEGGSANAVVNQGNITTAEGGTVAMIAAEIVNTGTIETPRGNTLMGAGSTVTLDLGGPVQIEVEEARLDTKIEQGGAIRADGGRVLLTAKAADELTASVINHSGITEAKTLASGENGEIKLMGDMESGRVEVAGRLDASAPEGGDGGFVETSAAEVSIANEVQVTTRANSGETGEWLIDPTDFNVSDGTDSQSDSGIGAETLSTNLANNDVTLQTVATGSEDGDINVNAAVDWDANTILTLNAHGDINLNAALTATGDSAGLALDYDGSDYYVNAPVTLSGDNASLSVNGTGYTLVQNVDELQDMNNDLGEHYALGQYIDASGTSGWHGGDGFEPVGDGPGFDGAFEGLGHSISDLTIERGDEYQIGLFGVADEGSVIRNVGLINASVTGRGSTGALVGTNQGLISSAYAIGGAVQGEDGVGGLVGGNEGMIKNAYATGSVTGRYSVGGLIGANVRLSPGPDNNEATVKNAYATGLVTGDSVGGLLGGASNGTIDNSYYATTDADGNAIDGGYTNDIGVGKSFAALADPTTFENWDTTNTWGFNADATLPGYQVSLPYLDGITRQQDIQTTTLFEGGQGTEAEPFTLTDWQELQNINFNSDVLTGDYHFDLINNLDASSLGYAELAGENANGGKGWNPIGNSLDAFKGSFEGQDHRVSDLTIERPDEDHIGLFEALGSSSTIRNIRVVDADITGRDYVASLVGTTLGTGSVRDVFVSGHVAGEYTVGGMIGSNSGSLENARASVHVEGDNNVGGLAGFNGGDIANAYATGQVNGDDKVGGLMGRNLAANVDDVYATGPVNGNINVGGLVGLNSNSTINNAYATGSVTGEEYYVGGLVGNASSSSVNASYYATTDADGNAIDGDYTNDIGAGKSFAALADPTIFENWDTTNTWGFNTDATLPGYQVSLPYLDGTTRQQDIQTTTLFEDGTGTSSDPYILTGWRQLQNVNFNRDVLTGDYHFDLVNNLDTGTAGYADLAGENAKGGKGFDPIGDDASAFNGHFDGLGHVISDLTIDRSSQGYVGLFGYIEDATLRRIGLEGGNVKGGRPSVGGGVGGLVGRSDNSVITDTYVTGSVTGEYNNVGGLVGYNESGAVSQSYATGDVSSSSTDYVGGLIGYNNDGTITHAYATGDVSSASGYGVGGLVGEATQGSTITYTYATGDVSADLYSGGLVGVIYDSTVKKSYATGHVSGISRIGGLVGHNDNVTVTDSFYATTDADGNAIDGDYTSDIGTGQTLNELQQLSTFTGAGWDIDAQGGTGAVWRIYDGHTAPLLRHFLTTLDVETDDATVTYNGTTQTGPGTWSVNGSHDADLILGTATATGGGQNAGTHAVSVDGLYSNQQGYDLTVNGGTLEINKADATVTANSDTVTYDGTEQYVSGFTATGLVNGEDESVLADVTTSGGTGTDAGSYAHTASGTDNNYALTFTDGALTIDKADATVTANSDTVTYDGTEQNVSGFTATGLVNGEDESVLADVTTSGGTGTDAGSYAHTASGTDSNYHLTFTDGALTIDKADATVTANSDTVTYNGSAQSVTGFTASGLVGGEDESVLTDVTTSGGNGTDSGTYDHTIAGSDDNYNLTFNNGALEIDKAPLTVTANGDGKTYDGQAYSGGNGVSYQGFVNNEDDGVLTGSPDYSSSSQGATNAGHYVITPGGLSADNYALTFADGTLTIDPAPLTVTANDDRKAYNGQAYSGGNGVSYQGFVNNEDDSVLTGSPDYSGSSQGATNAGSYVITPGGLSADNYSLTFDGGTLTIDTTFPLPSRNSIAALQQLTVETDERSQEGPDGDANSDSGLRQLAADSTTDMQTNAGAAGGEADHSWLMVENGGIALPAVQDAPASTAQ
ncbi:MBG domain-containing protein [Chromohalobacter nigrandesensis]|uniref:MBG domain-containing protein n=1 Tax=Chromohalobacter nigrandesensis TaxID=119863 RepID=UPI001FF269AC|nr:GLUG motif-containing protein [Chromohalobacter nigrandesensis]MCK0745099.1 filamentous hemagglutinin N-terminal domain-containing protein [Chromohalobacter nigrandesensis]